MYGVQFSELKKNVGVLRLDEFVQSKEMYTTECEDIPLISFIQQKVNKR